MKHSQAIILCVDDESGVLAALRRIFSDDFVVLTATTVEDGVKALKDNPDVSLVISDHRMPGINGFEFLKWCQSECPQVVRLALTGYPDSSLMKDALHTGLVSHVIAKPWDDEQLVSMLKTMV